MNNKLEEVIPQVSLQYRISILILKNFEQILLDSATEARAQN